MRIDVISIPEYLSLLTYRYSKAQRSELLNIHVHDLRNYTFDRHKTVDILLMAVRGWL